MDLDMPEVMDERIFASREASMGTARTCEAARPAPMAYEDMEFAKEEVMEQKRTTPEFITELQPNEIFVFGCNLKGMHGGVETIKPYVDEFIAFAKANKNLTFLVTRIGCGIAGFTDDEISPLFEKAHDVENIVLPSGW